MTTTKNPGAGALTGALEDLAEDGLATTQPSSAAPVATAAAAPRHSAPTDDEFAALEAQQAAEAAGELGFDDTPPAIPASAAANGIKRAMADNGTPYAAPVSTLAAAACTAYLAPEKIAHLKTRSYGENRDGLLGLISSLVNFENLGIKDKKFLGPKRTVPSRLGFSETASLMLALENILVLRDPARPSDKSRMLAVYDADKASLTCGTYRASEIHLRSLARRYCPDMTTREFAELLVVLQDTAPWHQLDTDPDLIAVGNGIVDYRTGLLQPFSPEHVFLSKLSTAWNPHAENVVIPNAEGCIEDHADPADCSTACLSWDVESWMRTLSDDPEIVNLLWLVTGMLCRPNVSWGRTPWYYSQQGNNGKGTLLSMQRALLGPGTWVSLPLATAGEKFGLSELADAGMPQAILTDENSVGTFVDQAADIKAMVTGDAVRIEGKNVNGVTMHWKGVMVQCLNEFPRIRDRSPSFLRRLLFIFFEKCFTGVERTCIKDDYLHRPEVLEYVLRRVLDHGLTPAYYKVPIPAACEQVLAEFREHNDPLVGFWAEMKGSFTWDLLPFQFLYDLYKAWMERNQSGGKPLGRNTFIKELVAVVRQEPDGQWLCEDSTKDHRHNSRMHVAEPLIVEFDLEQWINNTAGQNKASETRARLSPSQIKTSYRGLTRVIAPSAPVTPPPAPVVPVVPVAPAVAPTPEELADREAARLERNAAAELCERVRRVAAYDAEQARKIALRTHGETEPADPWLVAEIERDRAAIAAAQTTTTTTEGDQS